jgi:hypothetical protein
MVDKQSHQLVVVWRDRPRWGKLLAWTLVACGTLGAVTWSISNSYLGLVWPLILFAIPIAGILLLQTWSRRLGTSWVSLDPSTGSMSCGRGAFTLRRFHASEIGELTIRFHERAASDPEATPRTPLLILNNLQFDILIELHRLSAGEIQRFSSLIDSARAWSASSIRSATASGPEIR